MSDEFYEVMDSLGLDYIHLGATLQEIDTNGRIIFNINLDLIQYMRAHKLGRKMRSLYLYLDSIRKSWRQINQLMESVRNINRDWVYILNTELDALREEIPKYARSKKHAEQIVDQLEELLQLIESEINQAAYEAKRKLNYVTTQSERLESELYSTDIQ